MPTKNTTANDSLVTKVYSVNEFIQKVEELTKNCKKERKEIFYRGHAQYTPIKISPTFSVMAIYWIMKTNCLTTP